MKMVFAEDDRDQDIVECSELFEVSDVFRFLRQSQNRKWTTAWKIIIFRLFKLCSMFSLSY